ncbi:adenine phosphoribosyltransferase [Psychroflexus sp. CAK57W]|uniref:adenine phosphoribosyltransferase n=1 Tax=Psychroflexus curvus TaxID=2873595 RepID=UPI001CCC6F06|nr:adenine phosphoribosyltransferase [Psychroflexus curvus]MBZ9627429.1 adenine phosphoribosyltransferase [Psychroflexus curvus]MBZ9785934.1 adenine phosphoribosyltransferase [Psychroflexus curvus]
MQLTDYIRTIPDFPKQGISYKDITPLLLNPEACEFAVSEFIKGLDNKPVDKVVGIESRGFLFGMLLAKALGVGFIPIRKPKKLPGKTISQSYDLEYGSDTIEIHEDDVQKGDRILLHDDLLATGGTAAAACQLIDKLGGEITQVNFIIELDVLEGRKHLPKDKVNSLLHY